MPRQIEWQLTFVGNFWSSILHFLATTPVPVWPPFKFCTVGLSLTNLNFASDTALGDSITVPTFPGYQEMGTDSFAPAINAGIESAGASLPAYLFRQDDSAPPVRETIKSLYVGSLSTPAYIGGCNFPMPIGILQVGDGFSVQVSLFFGARGMRGRLVILAP